MGISGNLADLLFPRNCILCRRPMHTNGTVCPECLNGLPYLGGDDWQTGKSFKYCISLFYYGGPIAEAIKAFKYRGKYQYARTFGPMLARLVKRQGVGLDVVTYIPQSLTRSIQRGYNQARLLAAETAKGLGMGRPTRLLVKRRETDRQVNLSSAQRAQNLDGSFGAAPGAAIAGKRILIIDDVLTTGATLEECAGVLMQKGAELVICATLARSKLT